MEKSLIKANDFTFDVYTSGVQKSDNAILFLHGWPESGYMWDEALSFFSDKDFYCVAPSLRGFSEGARPKGKKNYGYDLLVKDIMAIADAMNLKTFHLVGHDWGGALGWLVCSEYPDRIKSWSALSLPHLNAFGDAIDEDPEQQQMSKYMTQFQWPWIPEYFIRKNDYKILRDDVWFGVPEKHVEEYLKIYGDKKGLTATLNYYRANFKEIKKRSIELNKIDIPSILIWGKNDPAIGRYGAERTKDHVNGPYQFYEIDAGHFIIQEKTKEVLELIDEHISKYN